MKRVILSCTLLLVLVGATSLTPSTKVNYSSVEAKLSVLFPDKFTTSEQFEENYKSVKTQCLVDDMVFFVAYTIHESEMAGIDGLAKVSLNAFIEGLEGEVTTETMWKVNKHEGIRALIAVSETNLTGEYRVVIMDNIQYQIMALSPEASWDKKKAKKFFKSFKVSK